MVLNYLHYLMQQKATTLDYLCCLMQRIKCLTNLYYTQVVDMNCVIQNPTDDDYVLSFYMHNHDMKGFMIRI